MSRYYLCLCIFIACSCGANNVNKDKKIHKVIEKQLDQSTIKTIEDFSNNVFQLKFKDCRYDSSISGRFIVKEDVEESEGVEWQSLNLFKDGKNVAKIENNWENKQQISRITFYDSSFKTKDGISVKSQFKEIKSLIDTIKLNNSVDGELVFHDIKLSNMVYVFDVTTIRKLYNGVTKVASIPDSLEITAITVFRNN